MSQRAKRNGHVMKNEITWKSRKKMSKLLETLRKKGKKGPYYYRVQVATDECGEFSLKTSNPDEALQQAALWML